MDMGNGKKTREVVLIPCYRREALLACCLRRIREAEPRIDIHLFPDRESASPRVWVLAERFNAAVHFVPDHAYYGNTANVMNAYLWAFNAGYDLTYLIEDDVFVHPDFFFWHRQMHEECPDIFASMAWIFNRHAPIVDDVLFQPWFYSIGVCFSLHKLGLIVRHATPLYYDDMAGYVGKKFKTSPLNDPINIMHFEQDGLIQRVLDEDKSQTISPGIAKCSHMGFVRSYGASDVGSEYERILHGKTFEEQIANVEQLFADPYFRISMFGREIVERELGHEVPKRIRRYRITLPGGWVSEFESELSLGRLPRRINSTPVTSEAKIMLL